MYLLDVCDNGDILSVLYIIKIALTVIRIAVPIILLVSLSLNYLSAVRSNDKDAIIKANKSTVMKVIAAILVFFIPTFVSLIGEVADPGNKTYIACLDAATPENISNAYRVQAEHYIDAAKESLKRSDYQLALTYISKVTNELDRAELEKELKEILEYIEIREMIYKVAADFNRDDYLALKKRIEAITDPDIKERLEKEMQEAIGSKGSLDQFIHDPNDPLYRGLKTISHGVTLKQVLERNGSSVEKLELQIQQNVEAVGVGTREAPAAAAFTLIETLATYGYKIHYDWGGKWYHIGVDGNWGKRITPAFCDSHPDPDRCRTNLIWKGFDCSGFVNWALINGFQNENNRTQTTTASGAIYLGGKNEAVCDIGDVIVNEGHITLVVGLDDENKRYLVAESSNGVTLSWYKYNNPAYYCRHIQYSN